MSSNKTERIANLSPVKQALFKLEEMQARLDTAERRRSEPVAIVGMGCRFPGGADEPERFWRLLRDGVDAVGEVPADRWDIDSYYDPNPDAPGKMYTRWGAFLDGVDQFDPKFFGISPREAASMDPQQRLLMEVTWEALADAGVAPESLRGSRTGVFVGMMTHDYYHLITRGDGSDIDAYYGTGNGGSSAAGRLSYNFGLQGPSISIDTACSSSLVTLHLACQSLRAGDCQSAVAGGVNLMLSPDVTIYLCRARALSAEGRCKTFDASADGYVRGEGCGVVVLKLLSQALADGDEVLALVRGSAVSHDGRSSGFTVPSGPAQQALIRDALSRAGVEPAQVGYLEAHGTGTSLGDPIEMGALTAVFGEGRGGGRPLLIGSVKTNVGHLEAAAGMAGLIKVVLSMRHETIPPHLHLKELNPHISLAETPLTIPVEAAPWPRAATPRIAGVSSFGLSGTIAHVVVEEAPAAAERVARDSAGRAWQRQRCWVESAAPLKSYAGGVEPDGDAASRHPLLGRHQVLAHPSESHLWEVTLDRQLLAYLNDHRIQGVVVLPGAAYVEMALAAASEIFGEGAHALTDIEFLHALYLPEDGARVVQVSASADGGVGASFLIHSRAAGDTRPGVNWTLHARGRITRAPKGEAREAVVLEAVKARCAEAMSGEAYYLKLREWGFQYGPHFRGIERLWRGGGEALGLVNDLHAPGNGVSPYGLHPALLDACLQAGWSQLLQTGDGQEEGEGGGARRTLMPVRFGEVRVYARPGRRLWSYARRRHDATTDGEAFEADFSILDDEGRLVAEIVGARAQYLEHKPAAEAAERADDWLYELQWRPAENEREGGQPRPGGEGGPRRWMIFADAAGVGAALAARLRERGDRCVLVVAGEKFERLDDETFSISPGRPEDVRRLFEEDPDGGVQACHGVVHMWSLDAPPAEETTVTSLEHEQTRGPVTALHVIQELGARLRAGKPRLWLVTRGAQAVERASAPLAVAQTMMWGFGRTVAAEHPDHWGGLIDLDPAGGAADAGLWLGGELDAAGPDDQMAFRGGRRYVARLAHRPLAAMPPSPLRWRADGSYLITGGLGDLGLETARWMVGQGARRLVLLGRAPLPPRSEWDACAPESRSARQVAAIRELEASGASVHLAFADLGDEQQTRSFVERFRREGWPPVRGVVYAAGRIEDRTLAEMDAESLRAVLRAKVVGGWLLHSLLPAAELDFFVFFSSASSLLNSPRLAGYAAANAFLDGLAHYRGSLGGRALSINWGPWAEVGMAARAGRHGQSAVRSMESITPDKGLEVLGRLLRTTAAQVAVLPIDWARWKEIYGSAGRSPFLAEVGAGLEEAAPGAAGARAEESAVSREIRGAEEKDRRGVLEAYLRRLAAEVLRLDAADVQPDIALSRLGLDSLMSIEIKNRIEADLGVTLPVVTLLQGPSVSELAPHVLIQLTAADAERAEEPGVGAGRIDHAEAAQLLANFDELSDDAVDELLDELLTQEETIK